MCVEKLKQLFEFVDANTAGKTLAALAFLERTQLAGAALLPTEAYEKTKDITQQRKQANHRFPILGGESNLMEGETLDAAMVGDSGV